MPAKKNITFEESLGLNPSEQEVITLKAALDMINDMVNRETMSFSFNGANSQVWFNTMTHKAYFNIRLVDFLSTPNDFFKEPKNYLERLKDICETQLFGNQRIHDLKVAVTEFVDWLAQVVTIQKRWFPSIELEIDLRIKRQSFITICGNISKHNFTQQTRQAKIFSRIMEENGLCIPLDQCLLALEDFYEQFYDDIFTYHSSTIAEFLNNIRWGIYKYMNAERERCVVRWYDEKLKLQNYKYVYPPTIVSSLGKNYYWNLMNDVINPPYIERFEVTKYLKMRY